MGAVGISFWPCGHTGRFVQTWISFTGPIAPDWMTSTPWRRPLDDVPWLPICVATLYSFAALRTSRASKTVFVSGFWTKACLPSLIAIIAAGAWLWSGVDTVTASMSLRSSILR